MKIKYYILLAFTVLLTLLTNLLSAQTVQTFTASTGTFAVPCGVTSLTVDVWGGGGGGGGDGTGGSSSGGGGGGGGYTNAVLTVTPGTIISYTVGAGGAAGGNDTPGGAGGTSTFSTATAGGGGGGAVAITGGTAGTGATANGAVGGAGLASGAGGTGGTAGGGGGAGGAGGSDANGAAGSVPGGGGGGADDESGGTKDGGAGGRGQIIVSYNVTSAGNDQAISACATTATLGASVPSAGTGTWTCTSGCTGVTITTPTLATSGVTGLDPGTPSTFVWTVTNAGCTTTTDNVTINSPNGVGCWDYCTPTQDGNYPIRNVTFGSINNSNTATGTPYQNFNSTTTTVLQAQTYTISVAATGAAGQTFNINVYFDWNNDGDYSDAGEGFFLGSSTAATYTITGSITVPAGATLGTTTMLVYNQYNVQASACQTGGSGQAESYGVIISYVPGTCSDGILNNGETQIDCGGPNCSACPPTCSDGIQNQGESGIDCGGPCGACAYTAPTTGIAGTYVGACMTNTCNGTYVDDGGASGDYSNNINQTYRVFCPTSAGNCIRLSFTSINMNTTLCGVGASTAPCDWLRIRNGATQGSPILDIINSADNGTTPVITASNESGCLTVAFYTNASGTAPGFVANISCVACAVAATADPSADCVSAIGVCNDASISSSASGPGFTSESCTGCTAGGENYSEWYKFQITSSGTLALDINPAQGNDDYDFAIYKAPDCGSLGSPTRCSYAASTGLTGLNASATDQSENVSGNGWVSPMTVTAGEVYYIMVNHWTAPDVGSGTGTGYQLDWHLSGGASLNCIVLPVETSEFNAVALEESVLVKWQTSSEKNNDFFTVEKSTNGTSFEEVGIIEGAGYSSSIINYSLTDERPFSGISYYRLKQTDFDGNSKYSTLKEVNFAGNANYFTVKPNPTNSSAEVTYVCNDIEEATIRILDSNGKQLLSSKINCAMGENTTKINLENYPSGLYLVTLTSNKKVYKTKLVKITE